MAATELADVAARAPGPIHEAIRALLKATVSKWLEGVDAGAVDAALKALTGAIQAKRASAMMEGARVVMERYDAAKRKAAAGVVKPWVGGIPQVPPTKAVAALLKRDPRLARTAMQVSTLYAEPGRWFSAAKASQIEMLSKVQGALAAGLKEGVPTRDVSKIVGDLTGWADSYADTVVRTNYATAYDDGIEAQARDPNVRKILVGYEIVGPKDSDARENHKAAVGWRASLDDPRWAMMKPPLGFRCRHSRIPIDVFRAEREGWLTRGGQLKRVEIPVGAGPDPGFRR